MAQLRKNVESIVCKKCAKLLGASNFYFFKDKYIPYCKKCCELLTKYGKTLKYERMVKLLAESDIIYSNDCFILANAMDTPSFEAYVNLLKSKKLQDKTFASSVFGEGEKVDNIIDNADEIKLDSLWGNATPEEIKFLESEYHEWASSYEINSKAMVDSVRQLCLVSLDIRRARAENNVASLDKLLRLKSQILGDANLKPVQETGNAVSDQITIGTLIKKLEQEEPIPEDTKPDWIDEMKIWIVGQLARMENLQTDIAGEFNKELDKYGIDMETIMEDGDA